MDLEPTAADAPVYDLRRLTRSYGTGDTLLHAIDGIDLRIDRGEFVVIAGPSGSGKTTLLQLLGALDRPTSGELRFEGRDLASHSDGELTELRLRRIYEGTDEIQRRTIARNLLKGHVRLGGIGE